MNALSRRSRGVQRFPSRAAYISDKNLDRTTPYVWGLQDRDLLRDLDPFNPPFQPPFLPTSVS